MTGTKFASLIVMTSCLWLLPVVAAGQDPANNQARPLVVVTGEGVVRLPPDRAFVVIAAESRAKNPSEAQRANAKAMTNVQERLEQMGIKPPAVRTLDTTCSRSLTLQTAVRRFAVMSPGTRSR